MKRSWLNRELAGNLASAAQTAAYPESVRFRLAGIKVPEMVRSGKNVASLMMSSPMVADEWQRNVEPRLAQLLASAIAGQKGELLIDGLAVQNIETVWPRLLLACGAGTSRFWASSMQPGLEQFALSAKQSGLWHQEIVCGEASGFLPQLRMINKSSKLVVTSFPHYPSGAIMLPAAWRELCAYCEESGTRLVNYNRSADPQSKISRFHKVAAGFENLSWLEIFDPCTMLGKSEGWSLVSVIGSDDFVADFRMVGGSGRELFLPVAAGVLAAFREGLVESSAVILSKRSALSDLCKVLSLRGLRLLVQPKSGYHALWQAPKTLDGEDLGGDGKAFNEAMRQRYSVSGLPLAGTIAYSPLDMPHGNEWLGDLAERLGGSVIGY
ncbi:hypothetical protein HGA34_00495 [Candidatus Falkowbacteria bacterium]|nr:hypothetical protein [Candidatus Falkowbacteria bacterium]